jgi:hypothetical protein
MNGRMETTSPMTDYYLGGRVNTRTHAGCRLETIHHCTMANNQKRKLHHLGIVYETSVDGSWILKTSGTGPPSH